MKVINKIKAFFTHYDEPVGLDLIAAEIKEGRAFLHPRGEKDVTYLVRSDDIEITLSKGRSLTEMDIFKAGPKEKKATKDSAHAENKESKQNSAQNNHGKSSHGPTQTDEQEFDPYKKRKFVVSLYPDDYDTIMTSMKEYGYKRADFVLACVNTASKSTMEKAHKKIVRKHEAIKKEQKVYEAGRSTEDLS